jgi:ubiquitin-conjugating enzyme E2 J2
MSAKCIKRLQQELKDMRQSNVTNIEAAPEETDLLSWYYIVEGPQGTPYEGGEYLGRIRFPPNYPFAPPSILMCTPSGRFQTETRICMSMSDYHPDSWSPAWCCSTILMGLLSFMVEQTSTAGSITTDDAVKRKLAEASHAFNTQHPKFQQLFPERCQRAQEKIRSKSSNGSSPTSPSSVPSAASKSAAVNDETFVVGSPTNDLRGSSNTQDIVLSAAKSEEQQTNVKQADLVENGADAAVATALADATNDVAVENSGNLFSRVLAFGVCAACVAIAVAAKAM